MKPKISQASLIENKADSPGTVHGSLMFKSDSRLLAAETPIIEVGSPLLEIQAWLNFRDFLLKEPVPMAILEKGAEQCFDMAWCHSAKNDMIGKQSNGDIFKKFVYNENSRVVSLNESLNNDIKRRACMIFYQTPMVHVTQGTFVGDWDVAVGTKLLCRYFVLDHGVVFVTGLNTVYELFNAPAIEQ